MPDQATTEAPASTPAAPPASPAPAPAPAESPAPSPADAPASAPSPAAAPAPKPEGAPEKYDFSAPEGSQAFDEHVLGAYGEVAKSLNLTQAQAQSVLDKVAPVIRERQMEQVKAAYAEIGGMPDTWEAQTKADKEIGGDKLAENLALATKVRDLGGPELVKVLNVSGMGNHPAVIKAFVKFGRMLSEDTFVAGSGGAQKAPHQPGDRLYGKKS
jgi:hypothetical protein